MLINAATFDEKRKAKRPPMALASVAKKAGVSERTLARIKNKEEMNPSTVEKIAKALDTSATELCAPPQAKSGPGRGGMDGMNIELAAARYRVSPELIEQLAPMLFVAVAELALKRRRERLDAWWAKVEELREVQPKFEMDSTANYDADSGISYLEDAYWAEREQIADNNLDGWGDDQHDHFFEALFSIHGDFDFEGFLPEEYHLDVDGDRKSEGHFPDNKLSYPRESLKGYEHGFLYPHVFHETVRDLSGVDINFYDPLGDRFGFFFEHPIARMAEEKLMFDCVPISRMPVELRKEKNALARAEWIALAGGEQEIPEVFHHWESVHRIAACRHYEEKVLKLTQQLEGLSGEGRSEVECELRAAGEKAAAWKALITPFDKEWYDKWETYRSICDEAADEVEGE